MKRLVIYALCAIALLAAAALSVAPAAAQQTFVFADSGATIGVSVVELTPAESGAAIPEGVRIQQVQEGGPAATAGFQVGDVVVEFDGERVRGTRQFARLVQETPPGREVEAAIIRDGNRQTLRVTPRAGRASTRFQGQTIPRLEPFLSPAPRWDQFFSPTPPSRQESASGARLGVSVITLDDQLAEYFGVDNGVLVTSVDAGSPAATAGVRAGDVILQVGARTVRAPGDVTAALEAAAPGATLDLEIMRDKKRTRIQATLPGEEREREPPQQRFRL